jgi:hypothetical protein
MLKIEGLKKGNAAGKDEDDGEKKPKGTDVLEGVGEGGVFHKTLSHHNDLVIHSLNVVIFTLSPFKDAAKPSPMRLEIASQFERFFLRG